MEKLPKTDPNHIPSANDLELNVLAGEPLPENFKVGQKVVITGGKHKRLIKDNEVCIIQEVRKTFLVIQVSSPENIDGRSVQCHRKFISSFKDELPEPVLEQPPSPEGETMPLVADDCVIVEKLPEEAPNEQGETDKSNITTKIKDVVESPTELRSEIERLKGVIADLEADIVSYRDMMLGHQNELEYLRKETGPTQEEKRVKNEKVIECIKILLTLQ